MPVNYLKYLKLQVQWPAIYRTRSKDDVYISREEGSAGQLPADKKI